MPHDPGASVERAYQDHFARLYHRVIDDERIGKLGLAAYTALARFADFSTGTARVKRTTLAEKARLSVRGLDGGLEELVTAGYLLIERIQNADGSWAPSRYQLFDTALAQTVVQKGGSAQDAPPPGAGDAPPPSAHGAPGVVHTVHEGGAHGATQERETVNERLLNEKPAELPLVGGAPSPLDFKQSINRRAQVLARGYVELVPLSKFPAVLGLAKKALEAGYADDLVSAAMARLADEGRSLTTETLRIELDGMTPRRAAAGGSRSEERYNAGMDLAARLREAGR
jgi:hypothetical protein